MMRYIILHAGRVGGRVADTERRAGPVRLRPVWATPCINHALQDYQ